MLEEILAAISLGHRVLNSVRAFQKQAASVRTETARSDASFAKLDALDERTSNLELIAKEQGDTMVAIERLVKESLAATEAIANRVGTIFWIAVAGCTAAVAALVLAIVALARAIR